MAITFRADEMWIRCVSKTSHIDTKCQPINHIVATAMLALQVFSGLFDIIDHTDRTRDQGLREIAAASAN